MPIVNHLYYFATRSHTENQPTVVLLHGAGGNHLNWPHNFRRLSGCRVLAPDLPGHGKSEGIGEQSIERYAEHIHNWLRQLEVREAVIAGHSMGGAIAQTLALQYPQDVRALLLLNTAATLPIDQQIMNRLATPATFRSAVDEIVRITNLENMDKKLRKQVTEELLKTRPGVFYSDFIACNDFDITSQLQHIQIPVCVITGEDDKMVKPGKSQELAEQLKYAEMHIIPQTGHMVMLDRSESVLSVFRTFIDNL